MNKIRAHFQVVWFLMAFKTKAANLGLSGRGDFAKHFERFLSFEFSFAVQSLDMFQIRSI